MQITFHETQLHLEVHPEYEFLLTNKEVALGYRASLNAVNMARNRHADELIEGKHWIRETAITNGGKQKIIKWTKKGIVRLGFFIKSEKAKEFRDWAEDFIVNSSELPNNSNLKELQETILKQNALIAAKENQNINKQLQKKMKQQLSLIVSHVSQEIMTRFEESLGVTSRSLELQHKKN